MQMAGGAGILSEVSQHTSHLATSRRPPEPTNSTLCAPPSTPSGSARGSMRAHTTLRSLLVLIATHFSTALAALPTHSHALRARCDQGNAPLCTTSPQNREFSLSTAGARLLPRSARAPHIRATATSIQTQHQNVSSTSEALPTSGHALDTRQRPAGIQSFPHMLNVLWKFSRPHTILGSAVCIPALSIFAAPAGTTIRFASLVPLVGYALVPSLMMNVYIVGLNQLFDVEIDRVNKPKLPLASGELSLPAGAAIVLGSLAAGLALGWAVPPLCSPALQATLIGSALLGTVYSLPPFRLKRFPLLASFCIMSVRGALINWGFFMHASLTVFKSVLMATAGGMAAQRWRCLAPVTFFTLFGTVIALIKDVPDVDGDRRYGISSFSVRMGQSQVLNFAVRLLALTLATAGATLGAMALGAAQAGAMALCARRAAVAAAAAATALGVLRDVRSVKATDSDEVYSFYMRLWKVFYGSYLLLPFAR